MTDPLRRSGPSRWRRGSCARTAPWSSACGHDGGLIAAAAPLALSPPIAALEAELAGVAQALADEGALRAALAGLDVTAATRHAPGRAAIGHALLDAADEYDADLVVVGRGAGSLLGDAVFGSISSGAVRDGRRPVLVVPA